MFRAVTGPTGVGKSALADRLALRKSRRMINADPFQFYQEIEIINNRTRFSPGVRTSFLATESLTTPLNAGDFAKRSEPYLKEEAIWVGTGLYLNAALYGLDSEEETQKDQTPFQKEARVDFRIIVIDEERDVLYRRLDARVDQMIEAGALEEAKAVAKKIEAGVIAKDASPLKAIGLRHLLLYIEGEKSWEEGVRLWKRDTRRLAKRQWTWLRKFSPPSNRIRWQSAARIDEQISEISSFLEIASEGTSL